MGLKLWLQTLGVAGLTRRFHSLERYAVRSLTKVSVAWQPAGSVASNMCGAAALMLCHFLDTPDITTSGLCHTGTEEMSRCEVAMLTLISIRR